MKIIQFFQKNTDIKYLNLDRIIYIERDIPFDDESPGWRLYYGLEQWVEVTNEEFYCEIEPVLRKFNCNKLSDERPSR